MSKKVEIDFMDYFIYMLENMPDTFYPIEIYSENGNDLHYEIDWDCGFVRLRHYTLGYKLFSTPRECMEYLRENDPWISGRLKQGGHE